MSNSHAATEQEQVTPQFVSKKGDAMRKAALGKIIWGLLIHLALMTGGAFAQGDYDYINQYLDVNYGTWVDENGDGYGEGLGYDVDADGYWDAYRFSTFANGYLNVVVFDTSGNESFSSARFYIDSNGTGRFNVAFSLNGSEAYVAYDPEEDGSYGSWTELTPPVMQNAPQLAETIGGVPVSFFTSSDPGVRALGQEILASMDRMTSAWTAPACNGSYNGCR